MSFSQQITAAIAAVRSCAQIDAISRDVAVAWGAGSLDDDAAGAALEALAARRRELGDPRLPPRRPIPISGRPPRPRSQDCERSICRRRAEVQYGMIPHHIAAHFTLGEQSALSVIARDVQINGSCKQCVDKIAAVAGVSARTVQRAQRLAERLGFIKIEARPRPGRKSDTNVITITSPEWATWLRLDRVTEKSRHGIQIKDSLIKQRRDPGSWRFPSAAERSFRSAKGGGGEMTPLGRALAQAEALLAGKARAAR